MRHGVDTSRLIAKLKALNADGQRMAKAVVQSQADLMVVEVKKNAPADLGKLRQSVGKDQINEGYSASVFVNSAYAAYVEFGTGTYVDVPPELTELAAKFRGNGNGSFEDFKIAITEWVKRHGIDEKFTYVIMLQILHDGLHPHPYFYPAYQNLRKNLPIQLQKAFKSLTLKANGKS